MNLKQETWDRFATELIVEGLEKRIKSLTEEVDTRNDNQQGLYEIASQLRTDLVVKCQEITEIKSKLREYEKRDKIEHFISKMGRRYHPSSEKYSRSWSDLFYLLYPSAAEEYKTRGKARKSIIYLLRSKELVVYDDEETIGKP